MRLITRSDFDGLVCGALLKEAGIIDSWKFAHPKDVFYKWKWRVRRTPREEDIIWGRTKAG